MMKQMMPLQAASRSLLTPDSQGKETKPDQHFQQKRMEELVLSLLTKGQQGQSVVTKSTMEMLSRDEDCPSIASTTNIYLIKEANHSFFLRNYYPKLHYTEP